MAMPDSNPQLNKKRNKRASLLWYRINYRSCVHMNEEQTIVDI